MIYLGIYLLLSLITAIAISLYDRGVRWSATKCFILGVFWPITLTLMVFIKFYRKKLLYNKVINELLRG